MAGDSQASPSEVWGLNLFFFFLPQTEKFFSPHVRKGKGWEQHQGPVAKRLGGQRGGPGHPPGSRPRGDSRGTGTATRRSRAHGRPPIPWESGRKMELQPPSGRERPFHPSPPRAQPRFRLRRSAGDAASGHPAAEPLPLPATTPFWGALSPALSPHVLAPKVPWQPAARQRGGAAAFQGCSAAE